MTKEIYQGVKFEIEEMNWIRRRELIKRNIGRQLIIQDPNHSDILVGKPIFAEHEIYWFLEENGKIHPIDYSDMEEFYFFKNKRIVED